MFFRKKSKPVAPAPIPVRPMIEPAGEPDLRAVGYALWRKKSTIILFTAVSAAVAFMVVNAITPRYRSEARLLLEARESVFMRAEADKGTSERANLDPEAVTSQIQLVLSRDLAVMDASAISLARENRLPIIVFNIRAPGAFGAVMRGEGRFTTILEPR